MAWLFEKWGCTGIRQDVSEFNNGNQGIALSPLISVQRKLSAKTLSMNELFAKFVAGQGWVKPAMATATVNV